MGTGKDEQHDRLGFELGAAEYVVKLISSDYLSRMINKVLK